MTKEELGTHGKSDSPGSLIYDPYERCPGVQIVVVLGGGRFRGGVVYEGWHLVCEPRDEIYLLHISTGNTHFVECPKQKTHSND